MSEYKLCYISGNCAWFTTAPLDVQWGDDWSDRPFDCNAGDPYEWDTHRGCDKYELKKIFFDCNYLSSPADLGHYSVKDINSGIVAWLCPWWSDKGEVIHAGVSIEEFKKLIWKSDGEIYIKEERED